METTDPEAAQMLKWANTVDSRIQSVSAGIACLLLALHLQFQIKPLFIEKILRESENFKIPLTTESAEDTEKIFF